MDFYVETGDLDLKRQMDTLLGTRAGSVPADREFGISWECLDEPPEAAESLFYQEVLAKAERYVPAAEVKRVEITGTAEGKLLARICCERRREG